MLLIREKGMRGITSHTVHRYAKADNKNMQNYYKNKKSSSLKYQNVHNLDTWAMYKKFPVNDLKWVIDISELNENVFLKLMFNILEIFIIFIIICPFSLKKWK